MLAFFSDAISEGNHPGVYQVVRGLPVELQPSGRTDGRAWIVGRSLHGESLGDQVPPPAGKAIPQAQAGGRWKRRMAETCYIKVNGQWKYLIAGFHS